MATRATTPLPSLERETLEAKAHRVLRTAILEGSFADGQRLVQDQLAEELGVSRIPVRVALKQLASDGLVTVDERGAYFVRRFTVDDAREVYSLRALLEPYAVRLAIHNLTDGDQEELERLGEDLLGAADRGERDLYVEHNRAFHMALYELSRQRRLLRLIEALWSGMPSLTPILIDDQLGRSKREHIGILDAVRERDPEAAASLLRMHIDNACQALVARLERSADT